MMEMNQGAEVDLVRANTDPAILREIDQKIEDQVRLYSTQSKEAISRRIAELEQEWDIERMLQRNASALALTGVLFGILGRKKWLLLSAGVLGFLMQHSVQGWCPPISVLRRMGVRTRREIEREKYALKVLRGDFKTIPPEAMESKPNQATDVLQAVTA